LKKRNNTVRKVFNAKGIPRNMGNKEILGRVKVYNNLITTKPEKGLLYAPRFRAGDHMREISDFVTNGRVFNQRKRKALAELMLRFDEAWGYDRFNTWRGGRMLEILALKNEDVIRYIKYTADFFGVRAGYWSIRDPWAPHYIANLTYKGRRGPIREDPGAVRVLKKRTAFLKELLKVQQPGTKPGEVVTHQHSSVRVQDLPRNIRNLLPSHYNYIKPKDIWFYMQKEFPLPPHPKNAATKIQSAVRGMRNRKKLTTMRKAATTIQKTVRGVRARTTVKKMKTVAGRVSLRGKRKRSPQ
jgi:hypothetical protein